MSVPFKVVSKHQTQCFPCSDYSCIVWSRESGWSSGVLEFVMIYDREIYGEAFSGVGVWILGLTLGLGNGMAWHVWRCLEVEVAFALEREGRDYIQL